MMITENDWYEIRAEAFRRMTTLMAPGKDQSMAANDAWSYEERLEKWQTWNKVNADILIAIKGALQQ